jgi:hypothetical protein
LLSTYGAHTVITRWGNVEACRKSHAQLHTSRSEEALRRALRSSDLRRVKDCLIFTTTQILRVVDLSAGIHPPERILPQIGELDAPYRWTPAGWTSLRPQHSSKTHTLKPDASIACSPVFTEIENVLTPVDKVEAAYRRGDLFEKRRRLMEAWAGFLGKSVPVVTGAAVIHVGAMARAPRI